MASTLNMEYNSTKNKLIISEYGRNVQNLILYAKSLENDEERQSAVEQIVEMIYQMNPQSKNVSQYRRRIWKHVFRIADFELNVIPPTGEVPTAEDSRLKPMALEYPSTIKKHRHYGTNIRSLINRAIAMEEGPKKDKFVQFIGSFMKIAYREWNKDHYVSDKSIMADLKTLSEGKLEFKDDMSLDILVESQKRNSHRTTHIQNKKNGKNHRSSNRKKSRPRKRMKK